MPFKPKITLCVEACGHAASSNSCQFAFSVATTVLKISVPGPAR